MRVPDAMRARFMDLADALAASWDARTSYQGAHRPGNAAYGQCYATAHVVQQLHPELEIVSGKVRTPDRVEDHFWNALVVDGVVQHVDLTWQQFPAGSVVLEHRLLDRTALGDSQATVERCALLLARVRARLHASP